MGHDPARVHPLVQQVDGRTFTGTAHAREINDDRKLSLGLQPMLQVQQTLTQLELSLFELLLRDLDAQFGGLEH